MQHMFSNIIRTAHNETERRIQDVVNDWKFFAKFLEFPLVLVAPLIIGIYSDKTGRKFFLIFAATGIVAKSLINLVNVVWFHSLRAGFLFLELFHVRHTDRAFLLLTTGYAIFSRI